MGSSTSSAFTGVIIGLVSSFGSIILIALVIVVFWVSGCAGSGRILLDRLGRPGEYDDEQAFVREEAEALETMDEMARTEYLRAKGKTYPCRSMGRNTVAPLRSRCWLPSCSSANLRNSFRHRQPAGISADRHLAITVSGNPGKGRFSVGI
jgi:hypothetical protein